MKKFLISLGIVGLVGISYLWIAGKEPVVVETRIEINAPITDVWAVLIKIDEWENWSPIIKSSSGEAKVGNQLDITMVGSNPGEVGPRYYPLLISLTEPTTFHWRANMLADFVFTNDKIIKLMNQGSRTEIIHQEVFTGLLAPIFCPQMEIAVPPMLDKMNQALKNRIEG